MTFPPDLPETFAARAAAVNLRPEDVVEHFILGSGHGGQNRNKRATAVQLAHHPTGTQIRCFHRRKQHENRIAAWMLLLHHLEDAKADIERALEHQLYVEGAQLRGRTKAGKKKVLAQKKIRGETKTRRQSVR
ncbi:MAG: peptide chain release factor-like protein [Candidatus Peribacteraceae bacterium]|nr:peptide chain release factor-like protein [Candidatus Peribacteraceae bacterium]